MPKCRKHNGLFKTYHLSLDEAVALRDYTSNGFIPINCALRYGHKSFNTVTQARLINQALDKLPNYQGVVIHTVNELPDEILKAYQVGAIVTEKRFTSASYGFTAETIEGAKYKLIIQSKRSKMIRPISELGAEKEALFKSGTHFKVLKREMTNNEIHITLKEIE